MSTSQGIRMKNPAHEEFRRLLLLVRGEEGPG